MKFKTTQENFWANEFGDYYLERNKVEDLLPSKINLFSDIFKNIPSTDSFLEFGPNIGINLLAIRKLLPNARLKAVEINSKAINILKKSDVCEKIWHDSILNFKEKDIVNFSFTVGVLIHIDPKYLDRAYKSLYLSSRKYILVCEYYNPTPTTLLYRGHSNRLFKRDFAGDLLKKYPDLSLINYGFKYRKDKNFPLDDITWFLLKKNNS
tara:strand:- start:5620 stop:6246 length:627 start_codon:yes stop_codon:yes gene_type:complete